MSQDNLEIRTDQTDPTPSTGETSETVAIGAFVELARLRVGQNFSPAYFDRELGRHVAEDSLFVVREKNPGESIVCESLSGRTETNFGIFNMVKVIS